MAQEADKTCKSLENLKHVLKELSQEEETYKTFENKKETTTNNLKANFNLISDSNKSRLSGISESINEWTESTKVQMNMIENTLDDLRNSYTKDKIRKSDFNEKMHVYRESQLSVMFYNDKNIMSLYYLLMCLFIWLLIWVFCNDLKATGELLDSKFWMNTLSGWKIAIVYWIGLYIYSTFVVLFVKLIEHFAERKGRINYYVVFPVYFLYQLILYFTIFYNVVSGNFQFTCKLIISCEMARFSMKIHGYFREKMLYGLKQYHIKYARFSPVKSAAAANTDEIKLYPLSIELCKFNYYLFCPSLIYRDNYPRIGNIRWRLILVHTVNFTLCILLLYVLMRYICDPYFNFSKIKDYYSMTHFIFDSLRNAIPGVSFLVTGNFLLLHTWLNLWSEILRHGDRRFYEDWWNCRNFEEFYRKWNMVVHEWLYYYIYNDVLRLSLGRLSRLHAKLIVFLISVGVHELIVWMTMGFFFPILSFFFGGPGIIFTYIKPKEKRFNLVFWVKLFLGMGLLLVLYLREFKTRIILDDKITQYWHEWIPRTILMHSSIYKSLIEKSPYY